MGSSPIDLLLHQHPVRALAWVRPVGSQRHVLVSGCEGGRLLVWDPLGAGMAAPVAGVTMRASKAKVELRADAWDEDDEGSDGRRRRGRRGGGEATADGIRALGALCDGSALVCGLQSGGTAVLLTSQLLAAYAGSDGRRARRGSADAGSSGFEEDARGHWDAAACPRPPTGAGMRWTYAAASLVDAVPVSARSAVVRAAERAATEASAGAGGVSAGAVTAACVIEGRPDEAALFPVLGAPGSRAALLELLPHSGPVLSVAASPSVRALSLTAGTDGAVVLRSALQTTALAEITPSRYTAEAATSCAFSHARPLVFACGTQAGAILVMDGVASLSLPSARMEAALPPAGLGVPDLAGAADAAARAGEEARAEAASAGLVLWGAGGAAVTALSFSRTRRRLLAAGDGLGCVRVWRLPEALGVARAGEEARAARLARGLSQEPPAAAVSEGAGPVPGLSDSPGGAAAVSGGARLPGGTTLSGSFEDGGADDAVLGAVIAAKSRAGTMQSRWDQ